MSGEQFGDILEGREPRSFDYDDQDVDPEQQEKQNDLNDKKESDD